MIFSLKNQTDAVSRVVSVKDKDKILSRLEENSYYIFDDIYPIINELPAAQNEQIIIANDIENLGFVKISEERGNWQEGPRMLRKIYRKSDLLCTVSKYYSYKDKMGDSSYNLKVTEEIFCEHAD